MRKLHVSRRELKVAFQRLTSTANPALGTPGGRVPPVGLLCGLYAVECGLKLLLLDKRGVHTTDCLADEDLTHDLDRLLGCIGQRVRFRTTVKAEKPLGLPVPPEQLHELYRYGGQLPVAAERDLAKKLLDVIAYIRQNLPT